MDIEQTPLEKNTVVIPWTMIVEVVIWFTALELAIRDHIVGLYIAAGIAVLLFIVSFLQWRRGWSTNVAALASSLIIIATLGGIVFVPGPWPQHAIAALSVVLLWLVGLQRLRIHDDLRGRTMAMVTAVLLWLFWYSLISASIYLNLQLVWMVLAASMISALAALLVWLESGIAFRVFRIGLLVMAWFGAELYIVTWWLPTSILVGSAIATTIMALLIQASRHLWKGYWEPGRSRRYLVVGIVITAILLLTARWI